MKKIAQQLRRIAKEFSARKFTVLINPKVSGLSPFKLQIQADNYGQAVKASKAMFNSSKYSISIIGG